MYRRSMKEDTSDGTSVVAVSKFGLAGIPVKDNPGSLRLTKSGFLGNGNAENVNATSGNVRAVGTSRSRISNSTSAGYLVNGGFGYDRPWYGAPGMINTSKGKAFLGHSLVDSAASSRSSSIASSVNDPFKVSAGNGRQVARNCGKPISQGCRRKRVVSGDARPRIRTELDLPGVLTSSRATKDHQATPKETPRTTENAPRSILKHDKITRTKTSLLLPCQKSLEDDNRAILSAVTMKQQDWPFMPCRQQCSQTPSPTTLPPPPFRQSRIPRCSFFHVNGDFRQPRTLSARSKSSDGCCYRRQKFSNLETQYPARREDTVTGKKSDAKMPTEEEKSATREWEWGSRGGEVGATCDWGAAAGGRGVSTYGVGVATGREVTTSDLNDHRKRTRRVHSENDVRRNVRRSPVMDEEEHRLHKLQNFRRHYGWLSPRTRAQHVDHDHDNNEVDDDNVYSSDKQSTGSRRPDYNNRCSWSNLIDIITDPPQQQPSQAVAHEMAPPSVSSENSGSTRPYYRRIFGNVVDWLSRLTDLQWSSRKMITKAKGNHVVPESTVSQHIISDVSLGQKKLQSEPRNSVQGLNLSKLKLDNDPPSSRQPNSHLCSTTCSKVQKNPSELRSCLSVNSSKAQINQAELNSCLSATCARVHGNSSQLEDYPFLRKAQSTEQKLSTSKRQKNPGDPKPSSSRPELNSWEGRFSNSGTPTRPSDLTTSCSAIEISGSRLDRMQAYAADAISQMREPDFRFQKKLLKSETLLTKFLTKEFEETANMPSSDRRIAQLRKLLSELPVENFYVVEWLVVNNIINESNANRFGCLFHVKPHVLEVLTRHRDHLFPDAL